MANQNSVESPVDDPAYLLLKRVQETPVYYDRALAEFVNMPTEWKEELKKLSLRLNLCPLNSS